MTAPYVKALDFAIMDGNQRVEKDGSLTATVDFAALFAAGYRVVGIRCAVCYLDVAHKAWRLAPDPCFALYAALARAAGLVVIPYYFPSFAIGAPSVAEQVANAHAAAAAHFLPGVDLPMCVDVEFPGRGLVDTGRAPEAVVELVIGHVTEVIRVFGAAALYSSYNEWYELRFPNHPIFAAALLWCKTAYRLAAGLPVDTSSPPDAHVGPAGWDPRDYHRIPDPWATEGCWLEQIQGDARNLPGAVRQADVNRFRLSALGDSGPHVKGLQRRLGVTITGTFDTDTDAAVRALQAKRGLVVDGAVGPHVIAALWAPAA